MSKVFLVLLLSLFLSGVVFAETEVSSCQALTTAGETYVLTNSIDITVGGATCFSIDNYNIILDCNGYAINGTGGLNTAAGWGDFDSHFIAKNCYFKNANVGGESSGHVQIINNTFDGSTFGTGYYGSDGVIEGNVFKNTLGTPAVGLAPTASRWQIYNNVFEATSYISLSFSGGGGNNLIYNNAFLYGNESITLSDDVGDFNVSAQGGSSIIGTSVIGGNFYNNHPFCDDANKDGYCDSPVLIGSLKFDYLPLSTYSPSSVTPAPISDLTKLGESFRCKDDNRIKITTYGYCGNNTCPVVSFNSSELCQYGCDDSTNTCNPSPSTVNYLFYFGAVIFIIFIAGMVKYLKSR